MAHLGYNNWSPGDRLQNREVNDKTLRMGIKRRQRKRKRLVRKSKNELGKYASQKSRIRIKRRMRKRS